MYLLFLYESGKTGNRIPAQMIKDGDDTSHADHGKYGSKSDTDKVSGKDQTYYNREGDIAYIKTVLRKADALMNRICDCLYNTITGIWNDTHVKGKGGTDSG